MAFKNYACVFVCLVFTFYGIGNAQESGFSIKGQVYLSIEAVKSDPAWTDGVVFIGDAGFLPLAIAVDYLEERNIQAAIIHSPDDKNISLLFDGNTVKSWENQLDFVNVMGGVLATIEDLKAKQGGSIITE